MIRHGTTLIPTEHDRTTVDAWFAALARALLLHQLPTSTGRYRTATADEFMLMHLDADDDGNPCRGAFKHCTTRDHLLLHKDEKITIPIGGPFNRGTFDSGEEEATAAP